MINSNQAFAIEGAIKFNESISRLIIFPAGTKDTASTRLRVWPILELLSDIRERSFDDLLSDCFIDQQILWFQKKLTRKHLQIANKYKRAGQYVLYDCDESGPALSYWAEPHLVFEMFHIADQIVADTPERLRWIRRSGTKSRLSIVENQIDYGMPRDIHMRNRASQSHPLMRILWYGNSCNLVALKDVAKVFRRRSEYQLVLCGANPADARRVLPDVNFEIHEWSQYSFLDLLESCDLCIVSHNGTRSDRRKSGHKMITSICHGVPAIASATPDYMRIARYAGIENCLFSSASDLELILQRLGDPVARARYMSIAKPRLIEKYRPGSFAQNVNAILEGISNEQKEQTHIYQFLLRLKLAFVSSKFFRLCGGLYWRQLQA